jgi:hypothetical protein
MQRRAVVKAVLKWPRLLNIVNLEAALGRLEISLHKITLTLKTDKEFRRYICTVISTVPRVVGQDVGKKMDALSRLFPDWNLSVMVLENPRLLTQKTEVIIERYKVRCFLSF